MGGSGSAGRSGGVGVREVWEGRPAGRSDGQGSALLPAAQGPGMGAVVVAGGEPVEQALEEGHLRALVEVACTRINEAPPAR